MSPIVTSSVLILIFLLSLNAIVVFVVIDLRFSIAFSAFLSCLYPIMAFNMTTKNITSESMMSFIRNATIPAIISKIISGSVNWDRNSLSWDSFSCSIRVFDPYSLFLLMASFCDRPLILVSNDCKTSCLETSSHFIFVLPCVDFYYYKTNCY